MNFTIVAPRSLRVGGGTLAQLPEVLRQYGIARPLVVTDPVMVKIGLVERCLDALRQAGIAFEVFSDTVPEPTDTVIEAGAAILRRGGFDGLIGFGGGSPIDTAKAMSILATGTAPMRDYKVPFAADAAKLPVVAIPTTAGTGSEVTRFTVVTDTARDEKMLIAGMGALPVAAIVDYTLTFTVPRRTTADTGVDSFTHALEAFVSRRANPYSDAQARAAMALIGRHLRRACAEPDNAGAREGMMLGATLAGLAFSNASVALVHGMSRPIGAHFHVAHGLSNAMLLPAVTRFGLAAAEARYAEAARIAGFAREADNDAVAAEKLAEGLAALNAELDVPSPRAYGIAPDVWEAKLPLMAEQALASGSPANNPRVPGKDEIVALYRAVYAANA